MKLNELSEARAMEIARNSCIIIATGSQSDWDIGKGPRECAEALDEMGIKNYQKLIVSAHRTPQRISLLAKHIESPAAAVQVVICAAGGAAHLPGMFAAELYSTPVIGLPIKSSALSGVDSLYSIVQMPPGVPVGTMAIGGGKNAAIFAAQILSRSSSAIRNAVKLYRKALTDSIEVEPKL